MRNKYIKTSNKFLPEATYRLGLIQAKIILKLASLINKDDNNFFDYYISSKELMTEINLGERHDNELRKATLELLKKTATIREAEGDLQVAFLSSAKYYREGEKKGMIRFRFDPSLKPYLLQLKEKFTVFSLENVINLKSVYAIRIYEILKQYEKIGTRKITLEEFRKILDFRKKEYALYANFKNRVILPAQKELRQKTDIYFEFEEIKEVRSVVAIKFYIYPKKERKIPLSDQGSILLNKIKDDICLSNIKALDIIKKHDDFKIKLALNFTKQKARENKSGYFIKILSDPDFGKKEFGLEKKKQDRIKKDQADEAQRLAESDRIEAEQKKADQWIQQNPKEIEQIKVKIGEKQKQKAWFRELSPEAQERDMKRQVRFEVIDRLKKSGAGLSKQVQTLQE